MDPFRSQEIDAMIAREIQADRAADAQRAEAAHNQEVLNLRNSYLEHSRGSSGAHPGWFLSDADCDMIPNFMDVAKRNGHAKGTVVRVGNPNQYRSEPLGNGLLKYIKRSEPDATPLKAYKIGVLIREDDQSTLSEVYLCEDGLIRTPFKTAFSDQSIYTNPPIASEETARKPSTRNLIRFDGEDLVSTLTKYI